MPFISGGGGGGGSGTVTSVTAADTSIVIAGTAAAPTVATGTLDVIAADHAPAANWSNNSHKITSVSDPSGAQDAMTKHYADANYAPLTAASQITGNNQTGTSYTLALADAGEVVELNNAGGITLTIPTNGTIAFPVGTVIELWQQGAGQVTVSPAGGVTMRSPSSKTKLAGQYASATLRQRATDEWSLEGDIST